MRVLLSVAVVAAALTFAGASHAATGQSNGQVTLTIVTVPRLAGVHFALDGSTYVTGANGEVRIKTTHGRHQLTILDTKLRAPGLRSSFVRWGDSRYSPTRTLTIGHNTVLDAGFQQSVLVHFSFADRTGHPIVGRVTRLTLSNTLGGRTSFAPSWPQWLQASSIARRFTGLERTLVQYSIERAMVSGSNVVNHSQQRFYPARTRHVTAHLLLYSARVNVHDFIFGTGAGSRLDLIYPNGTRTSYPLRGKPLVLSSLPRGTYRVRIQADGYVPTVSLALSKNQVLSVKVISYYDMLLFLALVLGTVSALILIPRPYLRLRLRSVGSGRRPTPDDLEPPKPLSGERRQLIHTYMPDRLTDRPARTTGEQLPAQARRATILATGGQRVRPTPWNAPARLFRSVAVRLHRLGDGFPIVSGLRRRRETRSTVPRDFLAGERIELIHVYMGEQIAAKQEAAVAAQQGQEPDAAPDAAAGRRFAAARTGVRRLVGSLARLRPQTRPASEADATPETRPPDRVAPAASTSPAPAPPKAPVRATPKAPAPATAKAPEPETPKTPAPAIPKAPAPETPKTPAPATAKAAEPATPKTTTPATAKAPEPETPKAPAPATAKAPAPASPEAPAPTTPEVTTPAPATPEVVTPAAEEKTEAPPQKKRATPARKRRTPAKRASTAPAEETTAQPKRKRAPAKRKTTTAARKRKTTTAASKRKTTAQAKQKANANAKAQAKAQPSKEKASPQPATRRPARRPRTAAASETGAPNGRVGEAGNGASNDLELLRPDLAAAVKTLQDDLREARIMLTKKKEEKGRRSGGKARK